MPKPTVPTALDRSFEAGREAMLANEAAAVARLKATTRASIGPSKSATRDTLVVAVAQSVTVTRDRARKSGRESLERDAVIAGASIAILPTNRRKYDEDRAFAIATRFADDWERKASGLDHDTALDQLGSRLDLIGITESAESFNDERDIIITRLAPPEERRAASVIPFKIWDATMDKRTCQVCSRAHHTVVPFWMSFPDGRPGGAHPRCRCYEGLIVLPIWFDYEVDQAA
jgi:hypothetical protein